MALNKETIDELDKLVFELNSKFVPPELIVGCQVKDITDKDLFATNNGFIEAVVGKNNQQRCRYRGNPANVAVDDIIDVLYFKSFRLFVVFSVGGVSSISDPVTSVFGRVGDVVAETSDYDADQVDYDNGSSGLSATNVQSAIDEVAAGSGSGSSALTIRNNSGVTANAGDCGYISGRDYYLGTAGTPSQRCIVVTGGANGANIEVQVAGNVTAKYTTTDPAAGDALKYDGIGSLTKQSAADADTIAYATSAGSGSTDSGGTVDVLLAIPPAPKLRGIEAVVTTQTNLSTTSSVFTTIPLTSLNIVYQSNEYIEIASTSHCIAKHAGYYEYFLSAWIDPSTVTHSSYLRISKNGSVIRQFELTTYNSPNWRTVAVGPYRVLLAANDYLEFAAANLFGGTPGTPRVLANQFVFRMERVG